jgi:hypothetical protein
MSERTGEYIEQLQERNGINKGFWNSLFCMDSDKWGRNRRYGIRNRAHNELLQDGVDDKTMLSCPKLEDLPSNIRSVVENKLSKYLKDY